MPRPRGRDVAGMPTRIEDKPRQRTAVESTVNVLDSRSSSSEDAGSTGPTAEGDVPRLHGDLSQPEGDVPRPRSGVPHPQGVLQPRGHVRRPEGDASRPEGDVPRGVPPRGRKTRPKRGHYRKYNRQLLLDAVRAVQKGDMSVHRAGSFYGVPHSTLEYKVKERHLLRQRKTAAAAAAASAGSRRRRHDDEHPDGPARFSWDRSVAFQPDLTSMLAAEPVRCRRYVEEEPRGSHHDLFRDTTAAADAEPTPAIVSEPVRRRRHAEGPGQPAHFAREPATEPEPRPRAETYVGVRWPYSLYDDPIAPWSRGGLFRHPEQPPAPSSLSPCSSGALRLPPPPPLLPFDLGRSPLPVGFGWPPPPPSVLAGMFTDLTRPALDPPGMSILGAGPPPHHSFSMSASDLLKSFQQKAAASAGGSDVRDNMAADERLAALFPVLGGSRFGVAGRGDDGGSPSQVAVG